MKIGVIVSSTRPTRIGPKVAEWVTSNAPEGVEAELVDLAEIDLPFLADPEPPAKGAYSEPSTIAWAETVSSYDALIMTVPEYNASFPATLKNAIDTLYAEWQGKPIGTVSYGWGGGVRSLAQLVAVLDHIKAVPVEGPKLTFTEHLTPEGQILEAADEAELQALYAELGAKVPAAV